MTNEILVNFIVFLHVVWILFILAGFFWTVAAFFVHKKFFDYFRFRTFHLAGVLLVVFLSRSGLYCPLTAVEIYLRQFVGSAYSSGFILHHLQRWLNPEMASTVIEIGTFAVFLGTLAAYLFRTPRRAVEWFRRTFSREQRAGWVKER
jgi:hypothetical protein